MVHQYYTTDIPKVKKRRYQHRKSWLLIYFFFIRCRRALVILSQDFHKSAAADFHLKFAHCLSPGIILSWLAFRKYWFLCFFYIVNSLFPGGRSRKVVPVFVSRCEMPNILRPLSFVDFANPGLREWNWPRLHAVLKCPLNPDPRDFSATESEMEELMLKAGDLNTRRLWQHESWQWKTQYLTFTLIITSLQQSV
jgi:hypothetical protein